MKKRVAVGVAGAAMALMLVGASAASAATEFGSHCVGNRAEEGQSYAVIQLSQGGVPTAAPSSGVVTSWKIRLIGEVPFSLPQQLKVFRPTGNPLQFQVVGESETANVAPGDNTFATRIPIQAGDRIGLYAGAQYGALFCSESPETESPGNSMGIVLGNPTAGSTATLAETGAELLVPVAAVIEPDADNDGYGDETQDKCPQSAAVQIACPALLLDAVAQAAAKGSVTILVATSTDAPISVTGTVKLPGGSKKARVSAQATLKATGQTVTPGKIAPFKLKFPASLKSALKATPKSKKLTLKVKAEGKNVAGVLSTDSLTVKLKGQG